MTTTAFLARDATHMNFSVTVPDFFPGSFYFRYLRRQNSNPITLTNVLLIRKEKKEIRIFANKRNMKMYN